MLNFWRSHVVYQAFVSDTVSIFSENELLKLQSYSKSRCHRCPFGSLLFQYRQTC